MKAVLSHPHVAEWIDKAQDEPWVIEQYEVDKAGLRRAASVARVTACRPCGCKSPSAVNDHVDV